MTEKPEASISKSPEEKTTQSESDGENKQAPQQNYVNEFTYDSLDVDGHIEKIYESNILVLQKSLNKSVALQRLYKEIKMHDRSVMEKRKIKKLLKLMHRKTIELHEIRHRNGTCRRCNAANPNLVTDF